MLIGPQSAAAYKGAEAGLAATGQKHYEQEMADYKRDSAAQQAADDQIFGAQGLSTDPTAVATRRCLELGGSSAGCVGKGFPIVLLGEREANRLKELCRNLNRDLSPQRH